MNSLRRARGGEGLEGRGVFLDRVFREGPSEEVTCEYRYE